MRSFFGWIASFDFRKVVFERWNGIESLDIVAFDEVLCIEAEFVGAEFACQESASGGVDIEL